MELNINYKIKFTNKDIDDIMVTALEGGITHWCDSADVVGDYLGNWASDQISRGGTVKLHEAEEDKWYELTLEKFIKGLERVVFERGLDVIYNNELDVSNIDAEDADAIIQYAIFGEIVYG